jgi:CBS domain-containing protein
LTHVNRHAAPGVRGARASPQEDPTMLAIDVMTPGVITATPDTPIIDLIRQMLLHNVSAIPIVERDTLVGIVSEGDLIRRAELGTEHAPSYWRVLIKTTAQLASDYVHTHGRTAQQVMTTHVISAPDTASLADIAELMEAHNIKRLPVVRGTKLLGIVSRADLLRALAARIAQPGAVDDARIRDAILVELRAQPWGGNPADGQVMVQDGVVHLWGTVHSEVERQARIVAAEATDGVRQVADHMDKRTEPDPLDRPNWPSAGRP